MHAPLRSGFFFLLTTLLISGLSGSAVAAVGTPLHPGDSAQAVIQPAGDIDPFVFDGAEGGFLNATLSRTKGSLLDPDLRIIAPSGTEVDLTPFLKVAKKKLSLKKLPLTETGRYQLFVAGKGDTTGGYLLKTKGKTPKPMKRKGETIDPGETKAYTFSGAGNAALSLAVKIRTKGASLEVLDILTPRGETVTGFRGFLKTSAKSIKGRNIILEGDYGVFTLLLGGATEPTTFDLKLGVKFEKVKKSKKIMGADEPEITSLEVIATGLGSGNRGDRVEIVGDHFVNSTMTKVWFGRNLATTVIVASAKRITCTVPEGEGSVDVAVMNPDENVGILTSAFIYVRDPPTVTNLDPDTGPVSGGTVVSVTGRNFTLVEKVLIGNDFLSAVEMTNPPTVIDDNSLTFTTDPWTRSPGDFSVWLVDKIGQFTEGPRFTFKGPPNFAGIDPAGGSTAGGTTVTVYGEGLSGTDQLFLDGVLRTTTPVAPAGLPPGLRFTTPAHAAGTVAIRLVDRFGQETVKADGYEFNSGSFANESADRMPAAAFLSLFRGLGIAVGDVDGDKVPDLLIAREKENSTEKLLKLLLNDGTGRFTDKSNANLPATTGAVNGDYLNGTGLALGDLDGDGDLDLVLASNKDAVTAKAPFNNPAKTHYGGSPGTDAYNIPYSSTRVFRNDGSGKFTQITATALPSVKKNGADLFQAESVALGDIDGDKDLDIVLTRGTQPGVSVHSDSSSYAWYPTVRRFSLVYPPTSTIDLMSATRVLVNNGSGVFTNTSGTALPDPTDGDLLAGEHVILADVDGDGDLDIVLTLESEDARTFGEPEYINATKTGSSSLTRILVNDGNGNFTNKTKDLMPTPKSWDDWSGRALAFGDLDGDTYEDLVIVTDRKMSYFDPSAPESTHYVARTRILLGSKDGSFSTPSSPLLPPVAAGGTGVMFQGSSVLISDVDGDGKDDLLVTGTEQLKDEQGVRTSATRILLNQGSGTFVDATDRRMPNSAYAGDDFRAHAFALGDIDADGDLDLLLTSTLPLLYPTRALIFR